MVGHVLGEAVGAQGLPAVYLGEVVPIDLAQGVAVLFDVDRHHDSVTWHSVFR